MNKTQEALGLLVSIIKSGESWSPEAAAAVASARQELAAAAETRVGTDRARASALTLALRDVPDGMSAYRIETAIVDQFSAVRAEERARLRGSEVIPLVRQLIEVGDLAEQALSDRRWAVRVRRILNTVRGCELVWPDLFAEADQIERGEHGQGSIGEER